MQVLLKKTEGWFQTIPHDVLTLKLTLVFLLLHDYSGGDLRGLSILITLAGILMIVNERLLFSPYLWGSMFLVMGTITSYFYSSMDNHKYLIGYWTLACALALTTEAPRKVLAKNGRLLVGLAFAFAVLWKLIGGEYLNGEFFRGIFLLDDRFWIVTSFVSGLSVEALESFDDLMGYFEIFPSASSSLVFPATAVLQKYAIVISYWTILIESLIAASFLVKGEHGFQKFRDVYLMIFLLTTYVLAPVDSFAMILCIMGFAQLTDARKVWKFSYIAVFFMFQLWEFVPDVKNYFLEIL